MVIYVSPYNAYRDNQTGSYVISTRDANNNVKNFYDIKINEAKDYAFDTVFSGLSGELRDASGRLLTNKYLNLHEQKASGGTLSLGNRLLSFRSSEAGLFQFEYPSGTYAFVSSDDLDRQNIFWNVTADSSKKYQKLTSNLTNFTLSDSRGTNIAANPHLLIYELTGGSGTYFQGNQITSLKLTNNKASLSLAPGYYLATYTGANNQLYGLAFYAKNGSIYNLNLELSTKNLIANKKSFSLPVINFNSTASTGGVSSTGGTASNTNSSSSLKGRILLQVQDKGQAWYVNPLDSKRYSLGQPQDAFNLMRRLALGVSNSNFAAIENNPSAWKNLAGRILLKTQDNGRAYYFDPTNYRLYYLGRPKDAFEVMRTRGLGITNSDLQKISSGG